MSTYDNPLENTIVHIHLVSGMQIAARYFRDSDDLLFVEYPMLIEEKDVNGIPAMNLIKYLPFTSDNEQVLILKRDHVVSISPVTTTFSDYYYNTIHYNALYIQPGQDNTMAQMNAKLKTVLSKDSQDFAETMNKYRDLIPDTISTKMH